MSSCSWHWWCRACHSERGFDGAFHCCSRCWFATVAYCRPLNSHYDRSHCDANGCGCGCGDGGDDANDNRRCWVEILDRWTNHRALDFEYDADSPLEMNSLSSVLFTKTKIVNAQTGAYLWLPEEKKYQSLLLTHSFSSVHFAHFLTNCFLFVFELFPIQSAIVLVILKLKLKKNAHFFSFKN